MSCSASQDTLSLAILLVCRNRRETTLRALRRIREQDMTLSLRILLFDDASDDGTPQAVAREFPEVRIISGDGNAFWNGGLHRVWQAALQEPVSAFLWLNDDVELDGDAFPRLLDSWRQMQVRTTDGRFILVGATRGVDDTVSYTGMRANHSPFAFRLKQIEPTEELQPIDTFNGNIVLVTRPVVERIGINDPAYFHNWGDLDYGLRAVQAGVPVMLMPGKLGYCAANDVKMNRGYGSPYLTIRQQWQKVNTHHGLPFTSWLRLTRRHSGLWWPLHFLIPYRWLILPRNPRPKGDG